MSIDLAAAKRVVDGFVRSIEPHLGSGRSLLPEQITEGKAYEALVLCDVLEKLHSCEGYTPKLRGGRTVTLRVQGGPIVPGYAHFELEHLSRPPLIVYTDIEFATLSYRDDRAPAPPERSHYHELDVLVVESGAVGRPLPEQIRIGVECKATPFRKAQLRALLGVRRELGLLTRPRPTEFGSWPRGSVPMNPPSCLLLYSTDPIVRNYRDAADTYGVDLLHLPA